MSAPAENHTQPAPPPHIIRLPTYLYYIAPLSCLITRLLAPCIERLPGAALMFIIIALAAMLLSSTLAITIRLMLPPRTWPLVVALIVNLLACTLAGLVAWVIWTWH